MSCLSAYGCRCLRRMSGFGFFEFSRRAGDFGLTMILVAYRLEGGKIVDPKVGLGGVEDRPSRNVAAENVLAGAVASEAVFAAAGEARSVFRRANGGYSCSGQLPPPSCEKRDDFSLATGRAMSQQLVDITLTVNGTEHCIKVEPRYTLADAIRNQCGLTGTHLGCEHGVCGACNVLIDDEPVRSCLIFAIQAEGANIRTVESLSDGDNLHPLQEAFIEHHALQCGFCTPGFLMLLAGSLERNPDLTDRELKDVLSSNLCRCTGYQNIIKAARAAGRRDEEKDHWSNDPVRRPDRILKGAAQTWITKAESIIGRAVVRLEDPPLVRGRGLFAADVSFPRQLHMRVVRSSVPNGRLVGLSIEAAIESPGVVAVWTAADVADIPPIDFRDTRVEQLIPYRQPVLAAERVRYVGEPIAVVFAEDPYLAEDAADQVIAEVEELPSVMSADQVGAVC